MQISLRDIEWASRIVYADMQATPQYCWPLLCERLGAEVWVKHENHTPVGAFKIRGGLVYFSHLARSGEKVNGVISATRGNHGQSVGYAARRYGVPATIVVPHGNSVEKNAAMRALGVELIEYGDDFQAALEHAAALAGSRSLHMVPSFHPLLVAGVATYSLELLRAVADIDVVYVPIGLGSGICGMMAARDALRSEDGGGRGRIFPREDLRALLRRRAPHRISGDYKDRRRGGLPNPGADRPGDHPAGGRTNRPGHG